MSLPTHNIITFRGRAIQTRTPATEHDMIGVRSVIVRRRSDRAWLSAYVISVDADTILVIRADDKTRHYNFANVRIPLDMSVMSCQQSTSSSSS